MVVETLEGDLYHRKRLVQDFANMHSITKMIGDVSVFDIIMETSQGFNPVIIAPFQSHCSLPLWIIGSLSLSL